MKEDQKKPWKVTRSERGPDLGLFKTRFDWLKNPRNDKTIKAVVIESANWVNIVALTPEKKILTVRQFRFGIGEDTLEIPAGIMDPGETPQQAAMRELREETGFATDNWQYLGKLQANPAFMNNVCHAWLALDVVHKFPLQLDEGEEISLEELSLEEIRKEIEEGRMCNALALAALSRVFNLQKGDSERA